MLLLALLACPGPALAHQLDEYLQATLVSIEPGRIRFQINLTPGVAVADKWLGLIDLNLDGVISTNESAAYAEAFKRDLIVRLDGRKVELNLDALNFPELAEVRAGWGIMQLEYSLDTRSLAGGPHKLAMENRHRPVTSVYLFNAAKPESATIQISGQKRNQNQSVGEIAFDFHPPVKSIAPAGLVLSLAALSFVLFVRVWRTRKKQQVE
jgi:hypothetical protein